MNKRTASINLNFDELDIIFSKKELKDSELMNDYLKSSFVEYILDEINQGTLSKRIIVE